jgi:hypothetical protein
MFKYYTHIYNTRKKGRGKWGRKEGTVHCVHAHIIFIYIYKEERKGEGGKEGRCIVYTHNIYVYLHNPSGGKKKKKDGRKEGRREQEKKGKKEGKKEVGQ